MGKTKDLVSRLASLEQLVEQQGALLESLVKSLSSSVTTNKPINVSKESIEFCRYIRPKNIWGDVSNLNAVTLAIKFDFEKRTISFGWSICFNENFDRDVGRSMAEYRLYNNPITIQYPTEGIKKGGVVGVLAKAIGVEYPRDFNSWREVLRKI